MTIIRAPRTERDSTTIDNDVLQDPRLSLRALGLLARILSRPDSWRVETAELAQDCKEGRDAVRVALRELETAGYAERLRVQGDGGLWSTDVIVYDRPKAVSAGGTDDGFSGIGENAQVIDISAGRTDDGFSGVGDGVMTKPQVAPTTDYQALST